MIKSEYLLKHWNNNDLIKVYIILYASGINFWSWYKHHWKNLFYRHWLQISYFCKRSLTSKKVKQPSFSFSIKKSMLGCLDDNYSINLSALSRV